MLATLTPKQREHYDKIMSAIDSDDSQSKRFFLDGPGGSGNSHLYQTLTNNIKAQNKTVLCVASTGITAAILIHGMTAHKQFWHNDIVLDKIQTLQCTSSQ